MQNDDDKTQGEQNQQPNTENVISPTQAQSIPVNFSAENDQEPTQASNQAIVEPQLQPEQSEPTATQPTIEPASTLNTESTQDQPVTPSSMPIQPSAMPTITPMVGSVEAVQLPIAPNKKSYKKLLLIVAVIAAILLVSVAGVLAYMSMQTTPQERLQKAIVNNASLQAVQQDLVIESTADDSKTKGTISVQSDLRDPSVTKSKGWVDVSVEIFGIALDISNEFVCVKQTECYVNYSKFNVPEELSDQEPAFLGKWLQFDPQADDALTADPLSLISSISSIVLGEIITGNISGNAKETIEKYASNSTTYTFSSTAKEDVNSASAVKYDLKLVQNDILDINKAVAEQYELINPYEKASDLGDRFSIWVDTKTNYIVKGYIKQGDAASTLTFSKFNEVPTITAPESFLKPSEYTGILSN